jgi:epoxyqueuosine reductase
MNYLITNSIFICMSSVKVVKELENVGIRARFASVTVLKSVRDDIQKLLSDGALDRQVYNESLSIFACAIPSTFSDAKSFIVAAVPSPPVKVVFNHQGRPFETLVPPTYADSKEVDDKVLATMKRCDPNARFERAYLPVKTLASRTGVILYGRNNIGYVPERGSYHRLTSFLTDIEVEETIWREKEMLPACKTCRMCLDACPNHVILEDRFLIRAERCLTYLNEKPSDSPLPEWVRKDAHNALIGCMICQRVCPYDKNALMDIKEGVTFSEQETSLLLGDLTDESVGAMVDEKLGKVGLDRSIFPRNLKVLMESRWPRP